MLAKNNLLNTWLWKWHILAGLFTLPVMLILAITGTIYLFKDDVNHAIYDTQYFNNGAQAQALSLQRQFELASAASAKPIVGVTLAQATEQNTAFKVQGKGRAGTELFVNPYSGEVTGTLNQKETLMYDVRKLHGELLLGTPGTLVVELVASWFIVLILTGLYVWWPSAGTRADGSKRSSVAGLFTIRFKQGSRMLWRDLHAVLGFWLSAFMLIILAGAMPWTDVFGDQLKWVQQQTNTGYPAKWRSDDGIVSSVNAQSNNRVSLDDIANIARKDLQLEGVITITLPKTSTATFKVTNRAFYLDDQKVIYIDQYSGDVVEALNWSQVGVLMNLRQIFMRLHEGKYGIVNWSILLLVALLFTFSTIAGTVSYIKRKPKGSWGIPRVPARFRADAILVGMIILLGLVFPMFGISLLLITAVSALKSLKAMRTPVRF